MTGVNEQERDVILLYRSLPDELKAHLMATLEGLIKLTAAGNTVQPYHPPKARRGP